jgi:hypothetical protein
VDVLAVERRDKRAVEAVHHFVRDLIGFVLEPFQRLHVRPAAIGTRLEQLPQMRDGFFVEIGDLSEEVEKLFLSRQEAHGSSRAKGCQK